MDKQPPLSSLSNVTDPNQDFNLSEVESLSDFDWLDISSRASEDNESIGLTESDRDDIPQRPLSRRSSISHSSSRDGDAEGWEGLVEEVDLQDLPDDVPVQPAPAADAEHDLIPELASDGLTDEQSVKDALDQSMISTLSGSRPGSLSGSMHAPGGRPRDLRLSFPDPLTSSHDELKRSYDNVSPVSTTFTSSELADEPSQGDTPSAPPAVDPGFPPRPEVPEAVRPVVEFEVFLYGNAYANKWSFVEVLLEKLATGAGLTLSPRDIQSGRMSMYWLNSKGNPHRLTLGYAVSVVDRTDLFPIRHLLEGINRNKSLAIVFLPSSLTVLPEHDCYLPVMSFPTVTLDPAGFSQYGMRDAVEEKWQSMGIPASKLLLRHSDDPKRILHEDDVDELVPSQVLRAFEPLLPQGRRALKLYREQLPSISVVTILTILSLVLGYVVSGISQMPVPSASSTEKLRPSPVTSLISNSSTESAVRALASAITSDLALSSSKDLSLGVVNRHSSSLSTPTSSDDSRASGARRAAPYPSTTTSSTPAQHCHGRPRSPEQKLSESSLGGPLTSSLSLISSGSKALSIFTAAPKEQTPTTVPAAEQIYSLSTRLTSSLFDIFNAKMFTEAVRTDMQELLDALDELILVLSRQRQMAWEMSKSAATGLRDEFQRRNTRAQQRAREIREKGENVISSLAAQAQGRVKQAQVKARELKDSITDRIDSEVIVYHKLEEKFRARVLEHQSRRGLRKEVRQMMRRRHMVI